MRPHHLLPLLPLLLAGCGATEPTAAEENLSDVASSPVGVAGADVTGDRTDSLKYEDGATKGGDTNVSRMGTGAGSPGQSGAVEGGQQNPDIAAPTE